ncbi:DUF4190 domain-containing protein [Ammoniphilus sp. YIM 78166]|uniref:DUF4190 domain-containing protein n=1 Tax=Ammoniphilus sp. YIM 78166 TaxID=1644106 RepID=UPI00106F2FEE|nr:DUF4190 domain-containing protein [Ammoniphilus sp. YIM 78166]
MPKNKESFNGTRAYEEETASELTPNFDAPEREEIQEFTGSGTAFGIIGLVLSLLSLFTLPFVLSLIGIAAGFMANRRGARGLGKWAIGVGIISMVGAMLFAPFVG